MLNNVRIPKLIGYVLGCEAAGIAGTYWTSQGLRDWYPSLNKPSFNPPNSVFGPVWTTLYAMMGVSLYLLDRDTEEDPQAARIAKRFFALQLGLNVLWSVLFFGRRSPFYALIEIAFLWVAILMTILTAWKVSRTAALLLVPYLCWVSFASLLNYKLWELNK